MTPLNALTRRDFLKLISMGVTSLSLSGCVSSLEESSVSGKRPNILFIMSDDHAAPAISAYRGFLSGITKTPNLDRIAKEGMLFKNCFCTNSICAPSRAVILTGKYSHLNGVIDNEKRFDGSQQTYPKLLQQAGYETAMIGKWHLVSDPTGFDYWQILPDQGKYYNPWFIQMDGTEKQYEGYCTDLITDFSIDWLEKYRDKSKPFLLISQHKSPHRPWSPPPRHLGTYKEGTIPEPETLFPDHSKRCPASDQSDMSIRNTFYWGHDMKFKGDNPFPNHFLSGKEDGEYEGMTEEQQRQWDAYYAPINQVFIQDMKAGKLSDEDVVRWKYQRYMHDYLGTVAAMDDSIGRLLDYLDEKGLAENTIIVYTSDQGFFLGDHGWFDKRFMYEDSLRMPLVVRWPNTIKPGSVNKDIVLNLDFAETFLDIAGVKIPADMQGQSMKPILLGNTPKDWRASMYYHYYEYPSVHSVKRHYGIRTEHYKLIHFYYDIDCWELFDLKKDPLELTNLYDDPAYAQVVKKLKAELMRLKKEFGDTSDRYTIPKKNYEK